MNGFHDVSFPLSLAKGAIGGPERKTEVLTLASGAEVRNAVWAGSRRRWDVGGAIGDIASLQMLAAFFEARQGRLYGFRFRDPLDHSSAAPGQPVRASDQIIGIGDDETLSFQLVKNYGGTSRAITKPVFETVRIEIDGVEQTSGWSVDIMTGRISFDAPPLAGEVISAGFEFDCAVRFEDDRLQSVIEAFGVGRVVKVGLIELI